MGLDHVSERLRRSKKEFTVEQAWSLPFRFCHKSDKFVVYVYFVGDIYYFQVYRLLTV